MKKAFSVLTLALLTGCGGGGDGAKPGGSSTLAPFVNWSSSLKPNQTVQVSGNSLETIVVTDPTTKYFVSAADPEHRSTTITGTLNTKGDNFSTLEMTSSSGSSLSFSSGIIKEEGFFTAESSDETKLLIMADPADLTWKYQSFGLWEDASPNFSIARQGYFSVGAVTPGSAIPADGKATYIGVGFGRVMVPNFEPEAFRSIITADVDFKNPKPTLDLRSNVTSGSILGNFSGQLEYNRDVSTFRGSVSNMGSGTSGEASGKFYGPEYQEIGGVFSLTGGSTRVIGVFGATR